MPIHRPQRRVLPVPRIVQPDDTSCGPTCLAQVLRFFGDRRPPAELRRRLRRNPDGGTLAVHLGRLALELGHHARLHPLGVRVFDPTWWALDQATLRDRLARRAAGLADPEGRELAAAWLDYVDAGGHLAFHEPSPALLVRILDRGHPIICGLSATWLYRESRTIPETNVEDDVLGWPQGHFVTVVGHTGGGKHFHIVDPSPDAPVATGGAPTASSGQAPGRYPLPADRLIHAILLGDITHDAVLLEVWPSRTAATRGPESSP